MTRADKLSEPCNEFPDSLLAFGVLQTRWEHFQADTLARGDEVRERFADAPHEIGGFFGGLADASIDAAGLFAARALPYGTIESESFDRLVDAMLDEIGSAGELDGLRPPARRLSQ